MQRDLESTNYQRDLYRERLSALEKDSGVEKLREALSFLRKTFSVAKRREKLSQLESHTDVVEIELLKYQLKSSNRKQIKSSDSTSL